MKVIFAGGGTAGHVNPALAIADYIKAQEPSEIYFSGGEGGIEKKLAERAGYEIFTFPLKGLSRSLNFAGLKQNVRAVRNTVHAVSECKKIIRQKQPDIVVGTGGYASYPMVQAAQACGIKTAVLEVNATPGVALKRLAGKADCVMVSFEETQAMLAGAKRVVVTGSPVREEIIRCRTTSYPPLFDNGLPTVVSFWGSVGALYMNEKMVEFIKVAAQKREFNLLHAAGSKQFGMMQEKLKAAGVDLECCDNIQLKEYIFDMDRALSQAALVICRAGGTLAELCAAGKPSIIVPSPYVTDNHQEKNARVLEKAGAAKVIREMDCTAKLLYQQTVALLNDRQALREMGERAFARAHNDALPVIYQTLRETIGQK